MKARIREKIDSLRFENVSLRFSDSKVVLDDASCDIPLGKIVWLKSKPGAGKSTILKLLNGVVQPTSGEYSINGCPVRAMSFEEFLPYRLNIGYSFDFGGLINNRTIYANLALQLEYHSWLEPAAVQERTEFYLERFRLKEVSNERPSGVPGGQRKATCVARAFMMEPDLLLLDDPTTGLRGELVNDLQNLLVHKRREGALKTVIVATEDEDFIAPLCDSIIELSERKLWARDFKREAA